MQFLLQATDGGVAVEGLVAVAGEDHAYPGDRALFADGDVEQFEADGDTVEGHGREGGELAVDAVFLDEGLGGDGQGDGDEGEDQQLVEEGGAGIAQRGEAEQVEGGAGGEDDAHEVGEKQQEGAVKQVQVAQADADAGHAERRDQGHGDGDTGQALGQFLLGVGIGGGDAGDDGHTQIQQVGVEAGADLIGQMGQRHAPGEQGGQRQRQGGADEQGAAAVAQQHVIEAHQAHGEGDDGRHQGCEDHGADDHRAGVLVQADGGQQDAEEHQHQEYRIERGAAPQQGEEFGKLRLGRNGQQRQGAAGKEFHRLAAGGYGGDADVLLVLGLLQAVQSHGNTALGGHVFERNRGSLPGQAIDETGQWAGR